MPPPRDASAEPAHPPADIAAAIEGYLAANGSVCVLEDGKVLFDLSAASYAVSTEHGRCTLQLWNSERNLVRQIVAATPRAGTLRLSTRKLGITGTRLLELTSNAARRTPSARESHRTVFLKTLDRVLLRAFPDWKLEGLRTAMDLERSFGPAYARGILRRGQYAWAVIAINGDESQVTIDGILTIGVLWLDHCRQRSDGRRLFQGLRIIVPSGRGATTLARLRWMNEKAAQWELYELDEPTEALTQRDTVDQGNLQTRLVHHLDSEAGAQRFHAATSAIMSLVPAAEHDRVEQRLRSSAELAFLLYGLEFARARIGFSGNTFAPRLSITVGVAENETELTETNRSQLASLVAELFARRKAGALGSTRDPLYRSAPERWLESVIRRDLAPLTRHLAPTMQQAPRRNARFANDSDPDSIGNRKTSAQPVRSRTEDSRTIPRLDPSHVYTQVPAIAGARDRGMLDLLGVTADGRLAVIELKANDDLHLALQGLDYWIRVRHHHRQSPEAATGMGEFQRHGYFRGIELSPLDPRLYLVAPALHVHPATETVLRYLSPQVEWQLLAIDERWREKIRVIWRRSSR